MWFPILAPILSLAFDQPVVNNIEQYSAKTVVAQDCDSQIFTKTYESNYVRFTDNESPNTTELILQSAVKLLDEINKQVSLHKRVAQESEPESVTGGIVLGGIVLEGNCQDGTCNDEFEIDIFNILLNQTGESRGWNFSKKQERRRVQGNLVGLSHSRDKDKVEKTDLHTWTGGSNPDMKRERTQFILVPYGESFRFFVFLGEKGFSGVGVKRDGGKWVNENRLSNKEFFESWIKDNLEEVNALISSADCAEAPEATKTQEPKTQTPQKQKQPFLLINYMKHGDKEVRYQLEDMDGKLVDWSDDTKWAKPKGWKDGWKTVEKADWFKESFKVSLNQTAYDETASEIQLRGFDDVGGPIYYSKLNIFYICRQVNGDVICEASDTAEVFYGLDLQPLDLFSLTIEDLEIETVAASGSPGLPKENVELAVSEVSGDEQIVWKFKEARLERNKYKKNEESFKTEKIEMATAEKALREIERILKRRREDLKKPDDNKFISAYAKFEDAWTKFSQYKNILAKGDDETLLEASLRLLAVGQLIYHNEVWRAVDMWNSLVYRTRKVEQEIKHAAVDQLTGVPRKKGAKENVKQLYPTLCEDVRLSDLCIAWLEKTYGLDDDGKRKQVTEYIKSDIFGNLGEQEHNWIKPLRKNCQKLINGKKTEISISNMQSALERMRLALNKLKMRMREIRKFSDDYNEVIMSLSAENNADQIPTMLSADDIKDIIVPLVRRFNLAVERVIHQVYEGANSGYHVPGNGNIAIRSRERDNQFSWYNERQPGFNDTITSQQRSTKPIRRSMMDLWTSRSPSWFSIMPLKYMYPPADMANTVADKADTECSHLRNFRIPKNTTNAKPFLIKPNKEIYIYGPVIKEGEFELEKPAAIFFGDNDLSLLKAYEQCESALNAKTNPQTSYLTFTDLRKRLTSYVYLFGGVKALVENYKST